MKKKEVSEVVAGGYIIDIADLPKVHFPEHPQWKAVYDATWNIHKESIQKIPKAVNPEAPYYVDERFNDCIFVWDTMFMMMFDKYGLHQFPTLSTMDNLYYGQTDHPGGEDDGYIPRQIIESSGKDAWGSGESRGGSGYTDVRSMNPPLFAWAEWEQYLVHGDVSRFSKVIKGKTIYERMKAHFEFIERYKKLDNGLYGKINGFSNGLDNTYNQGEPYRGNTIESGGNQTYNDLSIQQAQFAYYLAQIAGEMGNTADKGYFENKHQGITRLISDLMWDEDEKIFSNLAADGYTHTNVSTPTSLWALAGHVATRQQAEEIIYSHGENSNRLFRPYGLASADYTDTRHDYSPGGSYWRGSFWAPTSYQYIKGLSEYGYDKLAFEEALRHLTSVTDVYRETGDLWENYSSEYLNRGSQSRGRFVGWTGCLTVGIIIEDIIGVRMNAPENVINWNMHLVEGYGIDNLYMKHNGEVNRVSLFAKKRECAKDAVTFMVKADRAFTLNVKNGTVKQSYYIEAGTHTDTIEGESAGVPSHLNITASLYGAAEAERFLNLAGTAIDWVAFGIDQNSDIKDGLSTQITKTKGAGNLIKNVNTIGYSEAGSDNRPTYKKGIEMRAIGFENAMDVVKTPHTDGKEGFMFTVPADNERKMISVLVGVQNGDAILTANLSDESRAPVSVNLTGGEAEAVWLVDIPYQASDKGYKLFVKFTHTETSGGGSISMKGILLN